tara:strand:+ start:5206 stop:5382 length:177 start_codon:yes stop_codon:yes gene_type:complete
MSNIEKDLDSISTVFNKLQALSKELSDMDLIDFLKHRENTYELARYYSCGPYKKTKNN